MESRLRDAAQIGDVNQLNNLMRNDPLLFKPAEVGGENPLHIACIPGHVDFAKVVLYHRPEFATELSRDGFSPLHIASAYGHLDIVKELLKVAGRKLCLVEGKDGRIPLHYAVAGGKIEVIKELLSVCLVSLAKVTAGGETCFHIALKNNQFGAIGILTNQVMTLNRRLIKYVLNKKDEQGDSILHLAISEKQYEVLEFLLQNMRSHLEVNVLNRSGLTSLDLLMSEGGRPGIQEMLIACNKEASGFKNTLTILKDRVVAFRYIRLNISSDVRNAMLVVAVLIVTATYQSILSPPGSYWQDDFQPSYNKTTNHTSFAKSPRPHRAGENIMFTQDRVVFVTFVTFNSLGFFASLMMLVTLTRGLPLEFLFGFSYSALAATYLVSNLVSIPNQYRLALALVMPTSVALLALVYVLLKNNRFYYTIRKHFRKNL